MTSGPSLEASGRSVRSGIARALPWLLVAGACAALAAEAFDLRTPLDDAFISFRYARNLVEGLGLVYNPGEYVEGYTNLLWTLLVAGALALGFAASSAAFALGQASAAAALAGSAVLARPLLRGAPAALAGLAAWLVLATPDFTRWSASGMETSLFSALVVWALAAFAHGRIGWTTACAALATLTRPDGVLIAATLLGFHVLPRVRERRAWLPVLGYAAVVLALTLFRLLYYGSVLPNTFYAKVGGLHLARGLRYVGSFLASGPWLLLPLAGLALVREPRSRPGGAYCAVVCLYVIAIGGDAFPWRFLMPVVPWLAVAALCGAVHAWRAGLHGGIAAGALLAGAAVQQSLGGGALVLLAAAVAVVWGLLFALRAPLRRARLAAALLAALVAAVLLAAGPSGPAELADALAHPKRERDLERSEAFDRRMLAIGRITAHLMRSRDEPVELVAIGAIGSFGYHSRLRVLDLYGLVDPVIARSRQEPGGPGMIEAAGHERANASYVLARRPDYIFIRRREESDELPPAVPAARQLWADPDFERLYGWDEEVGAYRLRRGARGGD